MQSAGKAVKSGVGLIAEEDYTAATGLVSIADKNRIDNMANSM